MSSLDAKVEQWLAWDRDPATRQIIESLAAKKDTAELRRRLETRMKFNTAGLRSTMGAGSAHMNRLTVLQTAQGLAAYVKQQFAPAELSRGVVIGYDGRHHSREFGEITATVMHQQGVKTYLYRHCVPTPFVPYGVKFFKALVGVMVTASHNPKEYNGLKVYWSNGAQIVAPLDVSIAASIDANLTPLESSWAPFTAADHVDPYDVVFEDYFATLRSSYAPASDASAVRFTFTAMHGVGTRFTTHGLRHVLGLPASHLSVVAEQAEPNPDFPTVRFPNPEEGQSAFALSFATAGAHGASVVLANDPDADRLAVAERLPNEEEGWHILTGNEIGALLGWWAMERARRQGIALERCLLISTVVSSCILKTMAAREGAQYSETLTGFKFMGNKALERKASEGLQTLFAYEEAIGFMWGERVMDKDGVTAAVVVADLACYLRKEKQCSLVEHLQSLYRQYGYHFTHNSYMTIDDPSRTEALLQSIRTAASGDYPSQVAGRPVTRVVDLAAQVDTATPSRRPSLGKTPMITLHVDGGMSITIRGSGTEPKIKWYAELVTKDAAGQQVLNAFVAKAVRQLMQPHKFGLIMRPEDAETFSKL
ncbi:phosphomannomutase-like protein [Leishmania major strain Friedlin]|uniref:Phosphomannomutase-like protein n=1 Tax=Leishmania major TaxID=5664 RepID=Q4Q2G5_LEIMA|nr:phosphomannomutase-like protein [Leishmania major strain Friedlin]CAG9582257.1 phosphomannomutase-like_protein [Leishmania major strain Friedlin]CAJ08100.1 phosphomannomutase-like protein [Leishmania major strain Friedlin]|eukprot:XP_001686483.1 phosphomannomutase-like protein [Leishmania major strain Friedlin]